MEMFRLVILLYIWLQPLIFNAQFCYPPPMPPNAVANSTVAAMYLSKMLEEEDQLAAEALEQQGWTTYLSRFCILVFSKRVTLGCVIPHMRLGTRSRYLRQTFLRNHVALHCTTP